MQKCKNYAKAFPAYFQKTLRTFQISNVILNLYVLGYLLSQYELKTIHGEDIFRQIRSNMFLNSIESTHHLQQILLGYIQCLQKRQFFRRRQLGGHTIF